MTAATVIRQTLDSHGTPCNKMSFPVYIISFDAATPLPLISTLHSNGSSSSPRSVPVLDSLLLQLIDDLKASHDIGMYELSAAARAAPRVTQYYTTARLSKYPT